MAESLQHIKQRLKSVENIGQITKAMELVAATKMRRSQEIALSSRPYTLSALDLLATLTRMEGVTLPDLLTAREIQKKAIVVVTSDKGLAGAFNSAVLREFERYVRDNNIDLKDPQYAFLAVGQKAAAHLEKRVSSLAASFTRIGDYTTLDQVQPISNLLLEGYLAGKWDEVIVFSTHFKSALRQVVTTRKIFPVAAGSLAETAKEIVPEHGRFAELVRSERVSFFNKNPDVLREYIIEPDPKAVLESLSRHLVEAELYQLILEANASEHAARRMAMKSASDNAQGLAEDLTLSYNKSRQASITRELIEITAGAESLK
jgi:F-type H+-transporting ATPase subunit gamma